jgi:hypothetical protein
MWKGWLKWSMAELQANDGSLTPGRYVGVSPEEEDEGFNFEETLTKFISKSR